MRGATLLFMVFLSYWIVPILPANAQLSFSNQMQSPPEVTVNVIDNPITLDATGSATFRLAVQIPPDHHGYLDRGDEGLLIPLAFSFSHLEERGARVTRLSRPAGERDEQVHATVLRGKGVFAFRMAAEEAALPTAEAIPVTLRYQICNDITNICYAPASTEIALHLTADSGATASAVTAPTPPVPGGPSLTLSERVTALFQRYMQHLLLAIGVVFVAGLLASATPCVYPVLPITSAILMARGGGSRRRGQLHAGVYFLGLIFFYALLGIVAAGTGTALSTIMTSAWVNLGFAAVFVYFGLSMLGLYEFQFLPGLVTKLDTTSGQRRGFVGTFFMGTTAGLVVSPCVGPVVGAILLEITGKAAGIGGGGETVSMNAVVRGTALMASFGAGLGLPFLLVGLLSHWLPQSGKWLTKVKFALGIPILYFAYTYYLKGMETAGVATNVAHAILIGILAIGLAVFVGAFHRAEPSPSRSLLIRRALGIVLLIVGVHFLYNGLGKSGILIGAMSPSAGGEAANAGRRVQSTQTTRSRQAQVEIHGNLRWYRDFALAQQRAKSEQKPLFVDFYATWCANCKAFQQLASNHTALNAALQQAVLVKIYDTDEIFQTFQQDRRFPELGGVGGQPFLPLFAIYTPEGDLFWKGQNYQAVHVAYVSRAC
jgi:thiol:disulfide interchange protein DsbD